MWGYIGTFILGGLFGIILMACLAAGKDDK